MTGLPADPKCRALGSRREVDLSMPICLWMEMIIFRDGKHGNTLVATKSEGRDTELLFGMVMMSGKGILMHFHADRICLFLISLP